MGIIWHGFENEEQLRVWAEAQPEPLVRRYAQLKAAACGYLPAGIVVRVVLERSYCEG